MPWNTGQLIARPYLDLTDGIRRRVAAAVEQQRGQERRVGVRVADRQMQPIRFIVQIEFRALSQGLARIGIEREIGVVSYTMSLVFFVR